MRNPGGYGEARDSAGNIVDRHDTYSCVHCNKVVVVMPKQRADDMGGWCRMCAKPVCPNCEAKGSCDHFEKKLARMEHSRAARQSYGI